MFRALKIAVTALGLAACAILAASFAASYSHYDRAYLPLPGHRSASVAATQGHVTVGYGAPNPEQSPVASVWHERLDDANRSRLQSEMPRLAFRVTEGCSSETYLTIPHWVPLLAAAALAGGPWIGWSRRFRLRSLLIATTVAAIALGLIAAT